MKTLSLSNFLGMPQFQDEETQRIAKVIRGLSINIGVAALIGFVGVVFVFEEKLVSSLALTILLVTGVSAYTLATHGYIRASSITLLATLWMITLGLVSVSGGMRSLDIIFFVTGTAIAGLLLGQRGTFWYGGASVSAGIVFLVLEINGTILPNVFPFPTATGIVLLLVNLAILMPALNTTLNTLHHAIQQAHRALDDQRKIQEELRSSEEKFSKAFHASPMAIIIQRVSDRKYFDVNEGFTKITGYTREEALEHTINELNLYPDKGISARMTEQFRIDGFVRDFEIPFRRKNGEVGHGLVWGEPIEINGEAMYIAGTIDITERKKLEMLQSEQALDLSVLYKALAKITGTIDNVKSLTQRIAEIIVNDFHAYQCAVWLLSDDHERIVRTAYSGLLAIEEKDFIPMDEKSRVVDVAKTGTTVYLPDVRNDPHYQIGDPNTLSEFAIPLQVYGETIGVLNMESPNLDDFSDRTRRLVSAFAQNAALALQNAILLESLEASVARLKESQARINFFLSHTAEGVYRIDYEPPIPIHLPIEEQFRMSVQHGRIAECNDAFARMYDGTSREEMLGKPYIEFYGEEGYEANMEGNLTFYRQGYRIDDFETEEFNLKGEKVYFTNNVVGIIRDDLFVSTWGTQRDITPLKRALAELEKRNAELERFNYTLSHELKTPLVTMRGFLGYLENSIAKGNWERIRTDMARIDKAAEKLYTMINELLELSRIGRIINPPKDVPFEGIVQAGLDTAEAILKNHNIQVHVQPNLPIVRVDSTRLTEVIQNLIENSVKYMGNQPNPQIHIGVRFEKDEPVFFFCDNGIGIDPEYHERVFNIFEKLDPQSDGTGIGLTLTKRIIETHGGRIWVESDGKGKGTTFCFTLPTGA